MTISNKSTHSSLKLFFENLYEELCNHQVDETFVGPTSPAFESVPDKTVHRSIEKLWTRCIESSKREGRISHE